MHSLSRIIFKYAFLYIYQVWHLRESYESLAIVGTLHVRSTLSVHSENKKGADSQGSDKTVRLLRFAWAHAAYRFDP